MGRRMVLMLLSAAIAAGGCGAALASDWVEDDHASMPPVAPDRAINMRAPVRSDQQNDGWNLGTREEHQHLAQGGFLTGSATRTGVVTPPPVAPMPPIAPMSAPYYNTPSGQQLQGNADASRMMLHARTDTVVPPDSLKGWLDKTHPEFRLSAQDNPDAVIEVRGAWDKSSEILKAMGIRFHEVKAKELRDMTLTSANKVMVINCEGRVPADQVEPIRQWVIQGGYLISTDWTLHSFLERAFPGMIAWNGSNTKGMTVDARVLASDPALLAGIHDVPSATWKLDDQSQEVRVLRPAAVRVLARSFQLAQSDPDHQGILAVEFSYGKGKVLHLVGHFDYNSSLGFLRYILPDAIPGRGIGLRQAIATNFLMQALERPERAANAR